MTVLLTTARGISLVMFLELFMMLMTVMHREPDTVLTQVVEAHQDANSDASSIVGGSCVSKCFDRHKQSVVGEFLILMLLWDRARFGQLGLVTRDGSNLHRFKPQDQILVPAKARAHICMARDTTGPHCPSPGPYRPILAGLSDQY